MTDAKGAVELALYEALAGGIVGGTVYQDVPEDAPMPLVIVGDLAAVSLGGKGDQDRRVTATIVTLVGAEERAPLLELQGQVMQLLDGQRFTPAGWTLEVNFQDDDAGLSEDGASYVGTSRFEVLALSD
jgi:hypothetical protein